MKKVILYFAFLIAQCSFLVSPAGAQGMVSEIKVFALNEYKELADSAKGYDGIGNKDLDFRKGRGGGYVFVVHKTGTDTAQYITGVRVEARAEYGVKFNDDGKLYEPAPFFQERKSHYEKKYQGGLNGRDYDIYGGAYPKQEHLYISRTGKDDFNTKVLKSIQVCASKPSRRSDQTWSGPHAGGGRYFLYTWHTHESQYKSKDQNWHIHSCSKDQCGLVKEERHNFKKSYGNNDYWAQYNENHPSRFRYHYKKCLDCGEEVPDVHQWSTYTSDWKSHNKRCLLCNLVEPSDHAEFGKVKLPVDNERHILYCDSCGFLEKFPHDYSYSRIVKQKRCDHVIVEYTCSECYHKALFEEPGYGHDYNEYGICRKSDCTHPYEQPATEPRGANDSVFVIKSFGNLYWISDYVNNRRPKTHIRLDKDLIADNFMVRPWHPIGAADSTAFEGTFDGGGHIISMLQTEEPVAGSGYRGLFGVIGKGGTVENVSMAGCNMRGWDYIGAVAGVNEGTIKNCRVVFSIMNSIGSGKNLGGICGLNKGTISGCTTENSVWVGGVRDYAGGICGTNVGGTLSGNVSEAICGSGSDAVLPETASQQ